MIGMHPADTRSTSSRYGPSLPSGGVAHGTMTYPIHIAEHTGSVLVHESDSVLR